MSQSWIHEFQESVWNGQAELWLDPLGNEADIGNCTLVIKSDVLAYTWVYEGATQTGSFTLHDGGATWIDSWHQPELVHCDDLKGAWGLFTVQHAYAVPSSPNWGWRSQLSQRPDGSLVLQMTNIAPWGEEGRAVRMTYQRAGSNA